jgi:hypothetical protein
MMRRVGQSRATHIMVIRKERERRERERLTETDTERKRTYLCCGYLLSFSPFISSGMPLPMSRAHFSPLLNPLWKYPHRQPALLSPTPFQI